MTGRNRYIFRSRISEQKFRKILHLFSLGLDGIQISKLTQLNRNTFNRYLFLIRERISEYCELGSPLNGEIEVDESYFGAKRIKGKRDQGATGKNIDFVLHKNGKKIHTGHLGKVVKGKFIHFVCKNQLTHFEDFIKFEYDGFKWNGEVFLKSN
jgi:transposase